jgi:acyl carrier protein
MYTYGTDEEFWEIVADLEKEFGITFDGDEVMDMGEMTVRSFIELVVKKVEKQKGDQGV